MSNKSRNDTRSNNNRSLVMMDSGNKINDSSLYFQNKKKQESSQLGGVFNWDAENSPGINIRNIAGDYRKNTQQAKSKINCSLNNTA